MTEVLFMHCAHQLRLVDTCINFVNIASAVFKFRHGFCDGQSSKEN